MIFTTILLTLGLAYAAEHRIDEYVECESQYVPLQGIDLNKSFRIAHKVTTDASWTQTGSGGGGIFGWRAQAGQAGYLTLYARQNGHALHYGLFAMDVQGNVITTGSYGQPTHYVFYAASGRTYKMVVEWDADTGKLAWIVDGQVVVDREAPHGFGYHTRGRLCYGTGGNTQAWTGTLEPMGKELARGKPTAQSSTGWSGSSSRAVDGNTNGQWSAASTSHTLNAAKEWWRVDLQLTADISSVHIWNRADCCGSRINGATIKVGATDNVDSATPCAAIDSINGNKDFDCVSTGRFVFVQNAPNQYLQLAEVKVFGKVRTATPTAIPTATPTATPTAIPTAVPTAIPTATPTAIPTSTPTATPTANPTANPTATPTAIPTSTPTATPTAVPTANPTATPTAIPTATPTATPTAIPTANPSATPTAIPTATPTATPTAIPTANPSATPTAKPTAIPTAIPTATPTSIPTAVPTATPTAIPTSTPTSIPTAIPTVTPTATPTASPTASPSATPSATPTATPTATPSATPTATPTAKPTADPTELPTPTPTNESDPTEPGCYAKAPNGCPRNNGPPVWNRDVWGETWKNAGRDADVCLRTRKVEIDNWCGVSDTMMFFVPQEQWKDVRGPKSAMRDDARSIATCPSGYTLTGCSCHSNYGSCDGAKIFNGKCHAYNDYGGWGVYAYARCGLVSASGFEDKWGSKSGKWDDAPSTVTCPSGTTLTGCSCFSTHDSCDGALASGNTCTAYNNLGGRGVWAHARCGKIDGANGWLEVKSGRSSKSDDAEVKATCPQGTTLTGCTCYSPWNSCDGAIPRGNTCSAYNGWKGHGVYAQARCANIPAYMRS